ncbi:MAG: DMT family transporter [Candidatus Limnocylindrus sp.]
MSGQGGAAGAARGVSRRTVGILAALGSAAAWGLGATTSDYVLSSGMGNDTFLVLELGIGFLVLIGIGAARGELGGFRHPDLARAATTGLIEPWGAYTLGNIGIIFSSGAFVALVSSLNPVLIALLALPFLGERVSGTAAALMIVSIGGVVLVIGGDAFGGTLNPLGILFAVLGLFCAATYGLVSSKLVRTVPVLPLVALQLLVACIASAGVFLVRVVILGGDPGIPTELSVWVVAAATGIFGGAAPFILFLEATKRIPTTTTAQFGTLVPVIALIGGVIFLGDQPSGFQLLGTAIVVAALSALARYTRAH